MATKNETNSKAYTPEELEEYVEVTLFKDNDKYVDDLVVIVNGDAIKIPRGKPCKIRRKYALVIDQSIIQSMKVAQKLDKLAGQSKENK